MYSEYEGQPWLIDHSCPAGLIVAAACGAWPCRASALDMRLWSTLPMLEKLQRPLPFKFVKKVLKRLKLRSQLVFGACHSSEFADP